MEGYNGNVKPNYRGTDRALETAKRQALNEFRKRYELQTNAETVLEKVSVLLWSIKTGTGKISRRCAEKLIVLLEKNTYLLLRFAEKHLINGKREMTKRINGVIRNVKVFLS